MSGAKPKFACGQLVATPGALAALEEAGTNALALLQRHASGDWGDLTDEDKAANERALEDGSRIFSSYAISEAGAATSSKVWVITEAVNDAGVRASTCLLLPSEY